jgi:hypothetical protein
MTDDPDIWRAARDDAALVAARRADELLAATDFRGMRDLEAPSSRLSASSRAPCWSMASR